MDRVPKYGMGELGLLLVEGFCLDGGLLDFALNFKGQDC